MSPLFRKEVAAHRSDRLQGEIILTQPYSSIALTGLLLGIAAGAILLLVAGSYARTETARGILVTGRGAVKILAPRPGIVKSLLVQDGDVVEEGQRLTIIEVEPPGAGGARYTSDGIAGLEEQEKLALRRIELAELKGQADGERLNVTLAALEQQRQGLQRLLTLQSEFVRSARNSFEPIGELAQRGVVTQSDFERRRQAFIVAQQEEGKLAQQIEMIEADIARARSDLSRVRIETLRDIGEIRAAVQALQQQKSRLLSDGGYVVNAPSAGRVTAVQTGVGRAVGGAVPLLAIVPIGTPVSAEIFVPTRAIGFIRPDQEVRLLYDAFPYQRFGSFAGRIRTVSRAVLSGAEIDVPFKVDEPVYRVTAEVSDQYLLAYADLVPFQPGMLFTANIVLERRSFLDWLLAPFRAVSRRSS